MDIGAVLVNDILFLILSAAEVVFLVESTVQCSDKNHKISLRLGK